MRAPRRPWILAVLWATLAVLAGGGSAAAAGARSRPRDAGCQLPLTSGRGIKHVIYVVWDNTHLLRDNPSVPSDLEQMPHLLNFLRGNGTVLSNEHTPLIAHTANDVVTSETGLYPDRQGLNVANSYGYFNADGSISFPSAFTYWTDPVQTSATPNPAFNLVTPQGKNVPAPWVPFTRAGCNVGAIASGDIALENTKTTPGGDITRIFGTGSPFYNEAQKENSSGAPAGLGSANFEGLAIHCAKTSAVCAPGEPDTLPDEPGGYQGFKGLFGGLQVNPVLTGAPTKTVGGYLHAPALSGLDGTPITDASGNGGFPGFDGMNPNASLAFVASMQEHGVPVTFDYLTDAHDNQITGNASGPGSSDYVSRLHTYDQALARFFTRLARDGINQHKRLFVFTADEGDHFVGAKPTNPGCDGVSVACNYDPAKIGEINADLAPLLKARPATRPRFRCTTTPRRCSTSMETRGRAARSHASSSATALTSRCGTRSSTADLSVWNPIIYRNVSLTHYLADPTELRLLHMETGDPRRNPSFVMFANPNYYLDASSSGCPSSAVQPGCVHQSQTDAYNHGDLAPEINRTWLGMVGPGVKRGGATGAVWSDHTNDRPTMLQILGLHDDYASQGRVLTEILDPSVTAAALRSPDALRLQRMYTQLEAPVGEFGMYTLEASTGSLAAGDSGDATFNQCTVQLAQLGGRRDTLAARIQGLLSAADSGHHQIDRSTAQALTARGDQILQQALAVRGFCR